MDHPVIQALQEMIDRRAIDSLKEQNAHLTAHIESARWYQTTLLVDAIEKLMDTKSGSRIGGRR